MEHDFIIINSEDELIEADTPLVKILKSARGRSLLAQSMVAPIRRNLDYAGIARRALVVDPLPQGALPIYDKNIIKADRVTLPTFEIVSSPTIRITDIKQRRFNLIDRMPRRPYDEVVVITDQDTLESSV